MAQEADASCCSLCPSSGPPLPSTVLSTDSTTDASTRPTSDIDRDADGDPIYYWISCTKCSEWYHSACLLLVDDARACVPESIRAYLDYHGGIWKDWTGFVNRWFCHTCIAWALDPANPHPPHHPLTTTTNKRTWPPRPKATPVKIPKAQQTPTSSPKPTPIPTPSKAIKRSSSALSIDINLSNGNVKRKAPIGKRQKVEEPAQSNSHASPKDLTAVNRFYPTITGPIEKLSPATTLPSPVQTPKAIPSPSTVVDSTAVTDTPPTTVVDSPPTSAKEPTPPPPPIIESSADIVKEASQAVIEESTPASVKEKTPAPSNDAGSTPAPVKEETAASRPKRQAALNRPDYHALHNHMPTPTARWLDLIQHPEAYGVTIKEGNFPRIPGKLLRRSWIDSPITSLSTQSIPPAPSSRSSSPLSPDPLATSPMHMNFPPHLPPTLFYGPLREPLVVKPEDGGFESLGGKLPGKDLTVKEISDLVGPDHMVDVIDVATQSSSQWTMGKWAEYVSKRGDHSEPGPSNKVYNIISLEISGTELGKRVVPPQLVRDIDWVENYWQFGPGGKAAAIEFEGLGLKDKEKETNGTTGTLAPGSKGKARASQPWPKVQLYCLMGTKGSWTDWHVDFAASSVYYTVHRGSKTFFFIRPTEKNLAAYAEWSGSFEKQQSTWLGSMCDEVRKVTLKEGDTMIIPAGYIHSVHTPEDSIVFGGNFIHSYDIPTQLRLRQIEIDTKVPQRFRYPHFDRLCWYVANQTCSDLRQLRAFRPKAAASHERPPSLRVLQGLLVLAQFLYEQARIMEDPTTEDKRRKLIYDRIPSDYVKDPSGLAKELQWRVEKELNLQGAFGGEDGEVKWHTETGVKENKPKDRLKEMKRRGKELFMVMQKGKARTWNFHPTPWEQTDYTPLESITTVRLPRPQSPKNGRKYTNGNEAEEAEEKKDLYHQKRDRFGYLKDGSVVFEEQDLVITERRVTWRPARGSGSSERGIELGQEAGGHNEGCID